MLGDQILLVIREDFENQPFQALGGRGLRARDRPGFLLDFRQAAPADRFDNRILGFKEAVDIGRRHFEFRRNVGDCRFGEAEAAEQRLCGLHDPRAGVVRFGPDLRVHRVGRFPVCE